MLPQPLEPHAAAELSDARIPSLVEEDRRAAFRRALRHAGALFVQAVVVVALVALFFVRMPLVDGHSMAPQIDDGDRVLIDTVAYDIRVQAPSSYGRPLLDVALRPIGRGDVVAFVHGEGDERRIYLKRVIALAGDTVALSRGVVLLNGAPLEDSFGARLDVSDMPPQRVPIGSIFVLGDNRGDSDDSRSFGPVPDDAVVGRAVAVVWPMHRARAIR